MWNDGYTHDDDDDDDEDHDHDHDHDGDCMDLLLEYGNWFRWDI